MKRLIGQTCVSLLALGLLAAPSWSQDSFSAGALDIVDEVRLGLHFADVHYALFPTDPTGWNFSRLETVSLDILFVSPDIDVFRWVGSPRPELGVSANLAGRDSMAHLGLTWQVPLFETPFYLEGSFGAAVHNGALSGAAPGRQNFGCHVNFYERYGVGANVSDSVTATLAYEHTSNGGLCSPNDGLSNLGFRLGVRF
jgi:lipid A 3-O-deacylase